MTVGDRNHAGRMHAYLKQVFGIGLLASTVAAGVVPVLHCRLTSPAGY
jgi:hypothetical protein